MGDDDAGRADAADAAQAAYFSSFLDHERSESAARLAALTRRLTECMTGGDMRQAGHLRGSIRRAERELFDLDGMVDALKRRFPAGDDLLRPA